MPGGVLAEVVTTMNSGAGFGDGLKLADAPAGNRDAAKLIGPLKPSIAVIPMM